LRSLHALPLSERGMLLSIYSDSSVVTFRGEVFYFLYCAFRFPGTYSCPVISQYRSAPVAWLNPIGEPIELVSSPEFRFTSGFSSIQWNSYSDLLFSRCFLNVNSVLNGIWLILVRLAIWVSHFLALGSFPLPGSSQSALLVSKLQRANKISIESFSTSPWNFPFNHQIHH